MYRPKPAPKVETDDSELASDEFALRMLADARARLAQEAAALVTAKSREAWENVNVRLQDETP